MSESTSAVDNGVNVGALLDARAALTEAPEAAQFKWRATCDWVNGTHSKSSVTSFFGLGEEQNHRTEYTFDADHPEIFASQDNGATPVELVLVGLASCITAGVAPLSWDAVAGIAGEAVSIGAGCLWLQFGVISEDGVEIAESGGLDVVMDRCMKVEHARYLGRMHWLGFNTGRITALRSI